MHFCKAQIAIGGDRDNVYAAGVEDPVSWPEILILQQVHGEESIDVVEPFAFVNQSPRAERQRLSEKYREDVVALVFGGKQPPREMDAPGVTALPAGVWWVNPITRQEAVTEAIEAATPPRPPQPPAPTEPDDEDDEDDEDAAAVIAAVAGKSPVMTTGRRR